MLSLTQIGAWFVPNEPQAQNSFLMHLMELLGEWVMLNLVSIRLDMVLVSVQDRCMVFAKCIVGSEIILDTPDGTPF